jgi:hypothetical protein
MSINWPEHDPQVWLSTPKEHLWLFDKLIIARHMGYTCGPKGVYVPKPDNYMVRPIINVLGMGVGAHFSWLELDTTHIPHGSFWCEIFHGDHVSVDYRNGEPFLTVVGVKDEEKPLQRFVYWEKIENTIPLPDFLVDISPQYPIINCEFIGGKLIEVHLRGNPDFAHGNTKMIPVWPGQSTRPPEGMRFVKDPEGDESERVGIFID